LRALSPRSSRNHDREPFRKLAGVRPWVFGQAIYRSDGLLLFGVYLSTGIAMLAAFIAFIWLYLRITLAAGICNMAPAIALAGAMVGFTFPPLVASFTAAT
jgi:uncharacterized membrane protein YjfL (UPF0719 family)